MKRIVVGIDLSLTGLGLAAVPSDWDLVWSRIVTERIGEGLKKTATDREKSARIARLAAGALRFCERVNATHAWVEGYPASGRVFGLAGLAELGGVVRHTLANAGLFAETAPISTSRKLVLGKLPRSDVKHILHEVLRSQGAPGSWSGDELDAFVAANLGASELGLCAIVAPVEAA